MGFVGDALVKNAFVGKLLDNIDILPGMTATDLLKIVLNHSDFQTMMELENDNPTDKVFDHIIAALMSLAVNLRRKNKKNKAIKK